MRSQLKYGHTMSGPVNNMPRIATDKQLVRELRLLLKRCPLGSLSDCLDPYTVIKSVLVLHPLYEKVATNVGPGTERHYPNDGSPRVLRLGAGVARIEVCSRIDEGGKTVGFFTVTGINGYQAQFEASGLNSLDGHEIKLIQLACRDMGVSLTRGIRLFDRWLWAKNVSLFNMYPMGDHIEFTWPGDDANKISWDKYCLKIRAGWSPKYWKWRAEDENDY